MSLERVNYYTVKTPIQAIQWKGYNLRQVLDFVGVHNIDSDLFTFLSDGSFSVKIPNTESLHISIGQVVIKNNDSYSTMDIDSFLSFYEKIDYVEGFLKVKKDKEDKNE